MSIEITGLTYTYMKKTPFEKKALDGITFSVRDGETLGIIGGTGSGKSTLIQHLNGLIRVEGGKIVAFDIDLTERKPDFRKLRSLVGMVFQYPEYQLFEDTVSKDVAFAPRNQRKSDEEIESIVRAAISNVGLDYETVRDRSPFELSGGQKRRVAIAGVLAMQPRVLILDEPTSGLDPRGKLEILNMLAELKRTGVIDTMIIISHDMDEISNYADRIAVLAHGKLLLLGDTAEVFRHREVLLNADLDVPVVAQLIEGLTARGINVPEDVITQADFVRFVAGRVEQ